MANSKRKCRNCKDRFRVESGIVKGAAFYCGLDCMVEYGIKGAPKVKAKKQELYYSEKKKEFKLNDIPHQHKLTQKVFNRLRVLQELKWFKDRGIEPYCISCGKTNMDWCCGHYKTVGSQGRLRYDEKNTYLQCNRYCNMALSGNISGNKDTHGYTAGLLLRFGGSVGGGLISYCESETAVRKWSGAELKGLRSKFSSEIKDLL